jgi:hypothetical protein
MKRLTNNNTKENKMTNTPEQFIDIINRWSITLRCAGSTAAYYMAKKNANGHVLVKTSKSLSYIKRVCRA